MKSVVARRKMVDQNDPAIFPENSRADINYSGYQSQVITPEWICAIKQLRAGNF
jgi:hypothetical protein